MSPSSCRLSLFVVVLLAIAFGGTNARPKHKVVVVSFDGFALHYLKSNRFLPWFRKIMNEGVFTESIQSVFPSETFPNHFAMATGLYPESHGIVSNIFYDPKLRRSFTSKEYSNSDRPDLEDPVWWNGEPLWVTANRLGVAKTATSMWPGDLVRFGEQRLRATFYRNDFTKNVAFEKRIDQVIHWLTEDDVDVVYLYHFEPDDTGHDFGTVSPTMEVVLSQADWYLSYLLMALEKVGFDDTNLNLVLCSDHGMWNIDKEIYLEDFMNTTELIERVSRFGAHASIWPKKGKDQLLYDKLAKLTKSPGFKGTFDVYRKGELPPQFHYNHNTRMPPVMAVGIPGVYIAHTRQFSATHLKYVANHGSDPADFRMKPIFICRGPAFKQNYNATLETPNIKTKDLYAVVAALIGLKNGPPTNSSFNDVAGLFREDFVEDALLQSAMAKRESRKQAHHLDRSSSMVIAPPSSSN